MEVIKAYVVDVKAEYKDYIGTLMSQERYDSLEDTIHLEILSDLGVLYEFRVYPKADITFWGSDRTEQLTKEGYIDFKNTYNFVKESGFEFFNKMISLKRID